LADDSRIRAMVSETPLADEEHREAERTSSAMARHRQALIETIARLEAEQDELLDQLSAKRRGACRPSLPRGSQARRRGRPEPVWEGARIDSPSAEGLPPGQTERRCRRCRPQSSWQRTKPSSAWTSGSSCRKRATRSSPSVA